MITPIDKKIPAVKSIYELETEYENQAKTVDSCCFNLGQWIPGLALGKSRVRPLIPGELVFIMGDVGVGKSAIAQSIARAAKPMPVLYFSLELPGPLLFERWAAMHTNAKAADIEAAYQSGSSAEITGLLHIRSCDATDLSLSAMESTIAAEANKPGVVIVDYIGLLSDEDGRRSRSRYEFVSGVASQLKVIARRQNIIIIAITQMHRKGEDAQPEPHLHDARDTGQIEASAGLLLGVWRDSENTRKMFCKVLKNTKGQCGLIVPLYFDGARMQIREWTDKDTLEER